MFELLVVSDAPLEELAALPPDTPANEALRLLAENDVEELPVLDQGRLLGFVRRRDVLRWLALRTGRREPGA